MHDRTCDTHGSCNKEKGEAICAERKEYLYLLYLSLSLSLSLSPSLSLSVSLSKLQIASNSLQSYIAVQRN